MAAMVPRAARVLDVGCGHGELLDHLIHVKGCEGLGVEGDSDGFHACIARGIPVLAGHIEGGLPELEDGSFDVVVLSQELSALRHPGAVLAETTRLGRGVVVWVTNAAHWRSRARAALGAWMPSPSCSVADVVTFARDEGLEVVRRVALDSRGRKVRGAAARLPGLLAEGEVFLLERPRRAPAA